MEFIQGLGLILAAAVTPEADYRPGGHSNGCDDELTQAALRAPPEVAFAMRSWPLLLPTLGSRQMKKTEIFFFYQRGGTSPPLTKVWYISGFFTYIFIALK